jgi:hypothetical protein
MEQVGIVLILSQIITEANVSEVILCWIAEVLGPVVQNYKTYVIPNGVVKLSDYVISFTI